MLNWLLRFSIAFVLYAISAGLYTQASLVLLECPVDKGDNQANSDKEGCASPGRLLIGFTRNILRGTGHFIDSNKDDINAVSTVAVAAFTGTLWWVTWNMAGIAEKQRLDSTRAADAANKSAEVAERALISGQRAFVSVNFRANANKNIDSGEIINWGFTPIWSNKGDTPTRDMHIHSNLFISDNRLPDDWDFPDIWSPEIPNEQRVSIPVGASPEGSVDGMTLYVSIGEMKRIIAEDKFLYMWGWARYRDVFPETKTHITQFAIQIVAGGNPHDDKRISFGYPHLRKYNCSDEECDYQGYPADWNARSMDA